MLDFPLLNLFLASIAVARQLQSPTPQNFTLPLPMFNGSTPVIDTVGSIPLDGVYITEPNATSYEWWYFDAVSKNSSSSVVMVVSVSYSETESPELSTDLTFSYPNGSWTEITVPLDALSFSTIGNGSMGVAETFAWWSEPDLSEYTIELNLEEQGVTGEIYLSSISPPHVKCGPAVKGASLTDADDILWVNPVPDAWVSVDIEVNGTSIAFEGSGYHDKVLSP